MKVITFNGKQIIEPGAYTATLGGEPDAPDTATFGNAIIIDTGSMAGYGYGSGINGDLASGANSVYKITNLDSFKLAVAGSVMWDAATYLWKPAKALDVKGIDNLFLVHARTTTKSSCALEIKGGGTRASGFITFASNPAANDTITMNAVVFTFKVSPTAATEILIGATLTETLVNVATKLNSSTNASVKVAQYTSSSTRLTIKYTKTGTGGNSYTLAASVATPSGANLTGGAAGTGANGGVFAVDAIVEGLGANGIVDPTSSLLCNGFAMKLVAGTTDTAKFSAELYRGGYKGLDWNGVPFDNITRALSVPVLYAKSPEFAVLQELFDWADTNSEFLTWFKRDKANSSINGTGALVAGDITTFSGYNLFLSGTEVYNASDLTKVYEYIRETDYSFMLSDKYELDSDDTINFQHQSHINLQSEFKRVLWIGGGADATQFTQSGGSVPVAALFNDEQVHIAHSRVFKNFTSTGEREFPSLYFAASSLGRMAGTTQQTPMTWADLSWDGVKHEMSLKERETAIQAGVWHMRFVEDLDWVVNVDINTKQKNTQDIYADGTSPFGSIVRIKNLLNKEISKTFRLAYIKMKNANTASPADVKSFVENRLKLRIATKGEDNLILKYQNVKVVLIGSDYDIKYGYTPNGPINRAFITGFMFSVNEAA